MIKSGFKSRAGYDGARNVLSEVFSYNSWVWVNDTISYDFIYQ